jgi:hypothetical protein
MVLYRISIWKCLQNEKCSIIVNKKYDLRRNRATKKPKIKFIIHCEGLNTEPQYLNALKRKYNKALIEIQAIGGAGEPLTLCQKSHATFRKNSAQTNSFSKNDQYWVVFDRDEHIKFEDALRFCKQKKILVARSNPCFELWLILHRQDYDKACDHHIVQKHLAKLDSSYDPNGAKTLNFDELINTIEEAEARAEAQLKRRTHEDSPFGPPSTTFGHLTRAIRNAALPDQNL